MASHSTASIRLALGIVTAVVAGAIYQAATRPIGSEEAYLYDRFVRPTTRQVLASDLPDRDVLYSLLEKRSVGLFHVSPFSVRLPSILFGILYLWAVWRIAHRFLGAVALAGAIPLWLGWFARADGTGTAIALTACAIWLAIERKHLNLIGICLGLSVAAKLVFAIPSAVIALLVLALWKSWSDWTNRVLIPMLVVAWIFLVLPLSHAHASEEITPELTESQAIQLQTALATLRNTAGGEHIRIGASPPVEPIVNFYRAQHRVVTWERARSDYTSEHFDYYLLSRAESGWVTERQLVVLYQNADFVLAHASNAAM